MKHLLSILDLKKTGILKLIDLAIKIKKNPKRYKSALFEKTLFTFFQLPSLRTELSFDVAMFQSGGEVVDYHAETSPWAVGKESLEDVAKTVSKYCDIAMLRIKDHNDLVKFAKNASIPVINGLTSYEHPVQILGDLLTIKEKVGRLKNLEIAYIGDSKNNVTHSLIFAIALLGLNLKIGCPRLKEFMPDNKVMAIANKIAKKTKAKIQIVHSVKEAADNVNVVYADSWMSYSIPKSQHKKRIKILKSFQINKKVMSYAKKDALFMHCLPAKRGEEVTADVIDGKRSIVWEQAANRLFIQKAIILWMLK